MFGKIGITVFFLLFLGMGLLFTWLIGHFLIQSFSAYQWKPASATIVSSSVGESKSSDSPYFAEVKFRYEWLGESHVSDQLSLTRQTYSSYDKAQSSVAALPPGLVRTCYVNPEDPGEAVLERADFWVGLFILLPLVFVVVGAGGIYGAWFGKDKASGTLSPQAGKRAKGGAPWVLGAIFTLVGGGILAFWFLPTLARSISSTTWDETPCMVISSRVKSHSDSDGTTYSVDILYQYSVDGKEYKSNRYRLFSGSSSGYDTKAEVVSQYPPGQRSVCYVNPTNPTEVVLKPGPGWSFLFGLIPLAFMGAGIMVMIQSAKAPRAGNSAGLSANGSQTLKPAASPHMKVFGIFLVALFWNGIVSVFVSEVVHGFSRGRPDWFLTLFMVPFVAVGLGLVAGFVYQILALWNPRCEIQINPPVLVPGQPVEVSWTLRGSVHRLQRFLIYLEGREEATYRRGTSNYTDKETFFRVPLADTESPLEMTQGEAKGALPVDVMPTFIASNNKVVWAIKVRGEIQRWPDLNEEFSVTVTGGTQ